MPNLDNVAPTPLRLSDLLAGARLGTSTLVLAAARLRTGDAGTDVVGCGSRCGAIQGARWVSTDAGGAGIAERCGLYGVGELGSL
jgi:hypothetical protein